MPPESLYAELSEPAQDAFGQLEYDLTYSPPYVHQIADHPAISQVLTHAYNDARTLLHHADTGDGRSAAHAARALFEHQVNGLDVLSDQQLATRYASHQAITDTQIAAARIGVDLLQGAEQRREEQRLAELKKRAERQRMAFLERYGASFKRQWHPKSLRDRAVEHGLGDRYQHYQL